VDKKRHKETGRERESRNRRGRWNGKNHIRTDRKQHKPERKGTEQKIKSNISENHARHEERNARRTDAQENGSKTERNNWRGEGRNMRREDKGYRQTERESTRQ
jgi:hypothetical protein